MHGRFLKHKRFTQDGKDEVINFKHCGNHNLNLLLTSPVGCHGFWVSSTPVKASLITFPWVGVSLKLFFQTLLHYYSYIIFRQFLHFAQPYKIAIDICFESLHRLVKIKIVFVYRLQEGVHVQTGAGKHLSSVSLWTCSHHGLAIVRII